VSNPISWQERCDILGRAGTPISNMDDAGFGRTRLQDVEEQVEDVIVGNIGVNADDVGADSLAVMEAELDDLTVIRHQVRRVHMCYERLWVPNGLRLSCGPPATQSRKMASTGHSDRGGAGGPTASSAC
jgi:hypothetical protein